MTTRPHAVDVRRRAGWLPEDQDDQPYSLADMLAHDDSAGQFTGGTVYQAFLSATNYHRWHSPVAGTIVRAFVVEGTYYSEADSEGADAVEPMNSQSYLAQVAARAVILIQGGRHVRGFLVPDRPEGDARLPRRKG
jgi:phosphatidylserine decarboxylase